MSQLAREVFMTTGGLTPMADRLERDGPIARTRSTHDLHGYEARITPAGRRAFKRANRQHLQDVRELFLEHITQAELETLAGVWRRLIAAGGDQRGTTCGVPSAPTVATRASRLAASVR